MLIDLAFQGRRVRAYPLNLLRPGSVEVRRPPLGGKNEGSIPVVLGFFLRSVCIPIVESVRA